MTDWAYADTPVQFWDLFGEQGHPIRTTVSEMGPLLLARLMDLNEVQEGVLTIAFHVADKEGLLILDLDDLQAMLAECADARRRADRRPTATSARPASARSSGRCCSCARQGGEHFFGEPALDIDDFIGVDDKGRGIVNILAADKLMASPKLYSTFLLWLLSELFETLPEVGDPDKPKLVLLLRRGASAVQRHAQGAAGKGRAGRPADPVEGRRRLFHHPEPDRHPRHGRGAAQQPRPAQAERLHPARPGGGAQSAAETFRANPGVDVATAITELKVGEALVSLLQPDGAPAPVERTLIKPPSSRVGPVTPVERGVLIQTDAIGAKYDTLIDRESAEELLAAKSSEAAAAAAAAKAEDRRRQGRGGAGQARRAAPPSRPSATGWPRRREADRQARLEAQAQRQAEREAANSPVEQGDHLGHPLGQFDGRPRSRERSDQGGVRRRVARPSSGGGLLGGLVRGVLGGLFRGVGVCPIHKRCRVRPIGDQT